MKKTWLIVTLAAASALVVSGAVAIFTVQHFRGGDTKYIEVSSESGKNYFTSDSPTAQALPDLTYAAEKSVAAVVNIENRRKVAQQQNQFYGDPFFEFFGIPQQQQRQPQEREQRSGGSGVIISADGYIVSNNHVVEGATELIVTTYDNRTFKAKVIGTDPTTDIALIKIEATDLPTISFGNSDDLKLGQWVLAVGNPFSLNSTVTAGIVSARSRSLNVIPDQFSIESFIQTDAAINPGNSGGALVNTSAELVGINTVIKSPTGTFAGYGFAVPSTIVKKVVTDLREFGIVQRAMLGISFRQIDDLFLEQMGEETGIKEQGGIYVADVTEDGAAAAAGIKKGDVITEIDGKKVNHTSDVQEIIAQRRPNDKITVSAKRAGVVKQFDVTLRNKAGKTSLISKDDMDLVKELGANFREVNEKQMKALKINGGIQVVELGEGLLKRSRVKAGYIITAINDRPIRSVADLNKITDKVQSIDGIYPDGREVSYLAIAN